MDIKHPAPYMLGNHKNPTPELVKHLKKRSFYCKCCLYCKVGPDPPLLIPSLNERANSFCLGPLFILNSSSAALVFTSHGLGISVNRSARV